MTWDKKWKTSFNIDKCVVVSVTLKQTPIPANYTLHGKLSVQIIWGYLLTQNCQPTREQCV